MRHFSPQTPTRKQHSAHRSARLAPAAPPPEIPQVDAELYRLARGAGRLRLRIGQALHRLGPGFQELGFSTLGAYSLERCNRGGRWAAESRALARRLCALPHLTNALESGAIGWSMAELLARHATPQTEHALLQVARGKTVAAMRLALSPHEPPPDEELSRTLSLTLPVEEAWALEATRMMVEHMDGKPPGSHWLESVLAEATVSLFALGAQEEQSETETTAWHAKLKKLQHREAAAELQSHPSVATIPNPGEAPEADDLPTGIHLLDIRIRQFSAELASRDLFFGRIAQRFLALRGWQSLGFISEAHYARERLGLSRTSLRSKISLARRTHGLDQVVDALQRGQIGFEAAQLVARIATPETEATWLHRAQHRTFKHLREEVQAVEMATRLTGETDHAPPSDEHIQQMQSLERAILSGELLGKATDKLARDLDDSSVQISVTPKSQEGAVQISVTPSTATTPDPNTPGLSSVASSAKVTLRIRLPGDVLLHFRQLERTHRAKLPNTSFIHFLCTTFWQTWVPHLGRSDRWELIYRRDRYRCTNPVCHQRNVTLHHVKYRSKRGSDHPDNLTSPCPFCHLEGEHGGRLKILPPGHNPTWLLGRRPIMRIRNRERTLLN